MQSTANISLEGIEVLIAEEEANFVYLKAVLEGEKAKIIKSFDAYEVLDIIERKPTIPLILMNFKMPEMNGFETNKIIKSKHPNTKIIAQTAYALTGDRERALQDGCDGYISKPLRKEELLATIQNILFNNK